MASWSPVDKRTPARRAQFVRRLGGYVVPDSELLALAARLARREAELAQHRVDMTSQDGGDVGRRLDAARGRVSRDLELLSAALQRSSTPSH